MVATQAAADLGLEPHDLSTPLLMRAVYGPRPPKLIAVVRAPTARLHAAYHIHPHYHEQWVLLGGEQGCGHVMLGMCFVCNTMCAADIV